LLLLLLVLLLTYQVSAWRSLFFAVGDLSDWVPEIAF
jgi:hypothetical protein